MVVTGTDEPFAQRVGGKAGLSALGEAAERVRHPLCPRMLFRTRTELSSRGFLTRTLGPDRGKNSIRYFVVTVG